MKREPNSTRVILVWLLVYVIAVSATIGSACVLDLVPCLSTGDTRNWVLQLIAVIIALLAGGEK